MKKQMGILTAGVLCAAMLAGCAAQGESSSSVSSASSVSEESTSSSETASVSSSSQLSSEPNYEYITGDFTWDDCMKLPEYKGLELTKQVYTITDDNIEAWYQSSIGTEEVTDSDATVEDGDYVTVDYECKFGDEDYGDPSGEDYQFQVGSGSNIDGFEEGMIGLKAGQEVYLDLQFPDDYWDTDYAGRQVTFHVTLKSISRMPEITDEVVSEYTDGEYTTKEDYDAYIRSYLEESAESSSKSALRQAAWQEVYNNTEFLALPEEYVNTGMDSYDAQIQSDMEQSGAESLEDYLADNSVTQEEYEAYRRQYGESYAMSLLLVNALWDIEGMSEDDDLYKNALEELLSAAGMTQEEMEEQYGEDDIRDYCRSMAVNDFLIENGNITEEEAEI